MVREKWGDTAPPAPATARPMIRATDVGAIAHINEPTTNKNIHEKGDTFEDCYSDEINPFYIEDFI